MPDDATPLTTASQPTPAWLATATGPDATTLRLAVDHINANAHLPIELADIAAACHCGPRYLQLAFRRTAGTTPWAYVRSVRLARARRDLLRGSADHHKVPAIALRWGYTNPSRFSAEYRAAYGVTPGTTLRRPPTRSRPQPARSPTPPDLPTHARLFG